MWFSSTKSMKALIGGGLEPVGYRLRSTPMGEISIT
jgi:hypothetical protein